MVMQLELLLAILMEQVLVDLEHMLAHWLVLLMAYLLAVMLVMM
jgi:hypothetical protein